MRADDRRRLASDGCDSPTRTSDRNLSQTPASFTNSGIHNDRHISNQSLALPGTRWRQTTTIGPPFIQDGKRPKLPVAPSAPIHAPGFSHQTSAMQQITGDMLAAPSAAPAVLNDSARSHLPSGWGPPTANRKVVFSVLHPHSRIQHQTHHPGPHPSTATTIEPPTTLLQRTGQHASAATPPPAPAHQGPSRSSQSSSSHPHANAAGAAHSPNIAVNANAHVNANANAATTAAAVAAAARAERLLAQARRSPFDPATNKVRCRACGKAFASYAQLAQHLGASHDGINSEDAKYLQFRRQQQQQVQQQAQLGLAGEPGGSHGTVGATWRQVVPTAPPTTSTLTSTATNGANPAIPSAAVDAASYMAAGPLPTAPAGGPPLSASATTTATAATALLAGMYEAAFPGLNATATTTNPSTAPHTAHPVPLSSLRQPGGGGAAPITLLHRQPPTSLSQQLTPAPAPDPPLAPKGRGAGTAPSSAASWQTAGPGRTAHVGVGHREPGAAGTVAAMTAAGAASAAGAGASAVTAAGSVAPPASTNAWATRRLHWQVAPPDPESTTTTTITTTGRPGAASGTPVVVDGRTSSSHGDRGAVRLGPARGVTPAGAAAAGPPVDAGVGSGGWVTAGRWDVRGSTGVVGRGGAGSAAPLPPSQRAVWGTTTTPSGGGGSGPAVNAGKTTGVTSTSTTRRSKRVVTLADLLSSVVSSAQPTAAAAVSQTCTGAAAAGGSTRTGQPVRMVVSNALRVVVKAPAVRQSQPQSQPQRQAAGGGGGAPSGKRLRLTPEGTVAPPRRKPLSRAKKLILQHRANRTLTAAAADYHRARQSYTSVLEVTNAMQLELRRLQEAPPPPSLPAATAVAAAAAAAQGISASASALPPSLRPQLFLLALTKARPQLEALHRMVRSRRTAYLEQLRHHAKVHKQPELSDQELEQHAPLDLLPPLPGAVSQREGPGAGMGSEKEGQQDGGTAGAEVGAGGADAGGDGEEEEGDGSDDDSDDDTAIDGFQDVLHRWAEVLRLPRTLTTWESRSPSSTTAPSLPPPQPATVLTPQLTTAAASAAADPIPAARCAKAQGAASESVASSVPTSGPSPAPTASKTTGGMLAAAGGDLRQQPAGAAAASAASLSGAQQQQQQQSSKASSLPAWLAPSGDTSADEDEEGEGGGGVGGGARAAGAGAVSVGSGLWGSLMCRGVKQQQGQQQQRQGQQQQGQQQQQQGQQQQGQQQQQRGPASVVGAATTTWSTWGRGQVAGMETPAGRSGGLGGPQQPAKGVSCVTGGSSGGGGGSSSSDDDDDSTAGPSGWTDVLSAWHTKTVQRADVAALPLFTSAATGMTSSGAIWTTPASHPFVPSAAAAAVAASSSVQAPPIKQRVAAPTTLNAAAAATARTTPAANTAVVHHAAAAAGAAPSAHKHANAAATTDMTIAHNHVNTVAAAAATTQGPQQGLSMVEEGTDDDDDDACQLTPEAAMAAASRLLQQRHQQHQQCHNTAAAQQMHALMTAAAKAAQPSPPTTAVTAAVQASSMRLYGVPAATTAVAAATKSPWLQWLRTGGAGVDDDSSDDSEEDASSYGGLGDVQVDVLAGWMASTSLMPQMAGLFKQQHSLLQHQAYGMHWQQPQTAVPASSGMPPLHNKLPHAAAAAVLGPGRNTAAMNAAATTNTAASTAAIAATGAFGGGSIGAVNSASAGGGEGGGIRIINRAVRQGGPPSGPTPQPTTGGQPPRLAPSQPPTTQSKVQQHPPPQQQPPIRPSRPTPAAAAAAAAATAAASVAGPSIGTNTVLANSNTRLGAVGAAAAHVPNQSHGATMAAAASAPGGGGTALGAAAAAVKESPRPPAPTAALRLLTRAGVVGASSGPPDSSAATSHRHGASATGSSTFALNSAPAGSAAAPAPATPAAANLRAPAPGAPAASTGFHAGRYLPPAPRAAAGSVAYHPTATHKAPPGSPWTSATRAPAPAAATVAMMGPASPHCSAAQPPYLAQKLHREGTLGTTAVAEVTSGVRAGRPAGFNPAAAVASASASPVVAATSYATATTTASYLDKLQGGNRQRLSQSQSLTPQPQQQQSPTSVAAAATAMRVEAVFGGVTAPPLSSSRHGGGDNAGRLPAVGGQEGGVEAVSDKEGGREGGEGGDGGAGGGLLSSEFKCQLCNVSCNSRWTFDQHVSSKRHVARAAAAGLAPTQTDPPRDPTTTSTSTATAPSSTHHPPTAAAAAASSSSAAAPSPFRCSLCDVCCSSDLTWHQHLASRRHLTRAARQLLMQTLPGQGAGGAGQEDHAGGGGGGGGGDMGMQGGAVPATGSASAECVAATKDINYVRDEGVAVGGAEGSAGTRAGAVGDGCGRVVGLGGVLEGTKAAAAGGEVGGKAGNSPGGGVMGGGGGGGRGGGGSCVHRLCRQVLSPELDTLVGDTLGRIRGFQERAMLKNAIKAAAHRWYVLGLREVAKAVRSRRARCVVVAPNIEEVAVEGGLDSTLQGILAMCEEQGVPVVFALSRKHLGLVYGFKKKVSAVAVLELNGIHEAAAQIAKLAREARREWEQTAAAAAAAVEAAAVVGWSGGDPPPAPSANVTISSNAGANTDDKGFAAAAPGCGSLESAEQTGLGRSGEQSDDDDDEGDGEEEEEGAGGGGDGRGGGRDVGRRAVEGGCVSGGLTGMPAGGKPDGPEVAMVGGVMAVGQVEAEEAEEGSGDGTFQGGGEGGRSLISAQVRPGPVPHVGPQEMAAGCPPDGGSSGSCSKVLSGGGGGRLSVNGSGGVRALNAAAAVFVPRFISGG